MPRGTTKHVPNREQRALTSQQAIADLIHAEDALTPEETRRYDELIYEAQTLAPTSVTDRAAILERAKAHVASQAQAEKEAAKMPKQYHRDLWADEPEEIRPALRGER